MNKTMKRLSVHAASFRYLKADTVMRYIASSIAALMMALFAVGQAAEPEYPSKPVRLIVPYPAGGPTDLVARAINDRLSDRLGHPIVIDNRGGAATIIGAEMAARAAPDGYTLLLATVTLLAVNPALNIKLPYDPERDYAPISMVADQPYLLAVASTLPVNSTSQFVALAKSQPGKLTFGSAGMGSGAHLAGEMLRTITGIDIVHVPYKGTAPAITDLAGGHVSLLFGGVSALLPLVSAGKVRALAVSTAKRSRGVPHIPTVAESGIAGFEISSWNSLVAPRGTPKQIVDRLNAEIVVISTVKKKCDVSRQI